MSGWFVEHHAEHVVRLAFESFGAGEQVEEAGDAGIVARDLDAETDSFALRAGDKKLVTTSKRSGATVAGRSRAGVLQVVDGGDVDAHDEAVGLKCLDRGDVALAVGM